MNALWRGCFGLLAICGFMVAGCNHSATSLPVDAGRPIDLGTEVDAPSSTGGQGSGGAISDGGERRDGDTLDARATGGSSGSGGMVLVGGKSTTNGGTNSSVDAGAGFGGTSMGGKGGTSVAVTGGTKTGSGGSLNLGGSSTGGIPGTGGSKTGSAGSTSVGGSALGGTSGTGGIKVQSCPDSSAYIGNSEWPDKLVVKAGATYCGHFNEIRAPKLEQEYAAKAKLTVAPGTYALPSTAGTYPFALPVCFERRPGESAPVLAGAGQVKAIPSKSTATGLTTNSLRVTQPTTLNGSSSWTLSWALDYFSWTGTPQPPVLDGSILSHPSSGAANDKNPGYLDMLELCDGPDCEDQWQDVRFESCNPDYPLQRHTITFTGGQMVLDVRITGEVGGAIMLAAFTSASGTLDGQAFTQGDYWKLVYSADHHHFTRNFAVLFDAPIGDACGLKVLNFWDNRAAAPLPDVSTIRCDLTTIAARAASSATLEWP